MLTCKLAADNYSQLISYRKSFKPVFRCNWKKPRMFRMATSEEVTESNRRSRTDVASDVTATLSLVTL